jgi:hypothetical protein
MRDDLHREVPPGDWPAGKEDKRRHGEFNLVVTAKNKEDAIDTQEAHQRCPRTTDLFQGDTYVICCTS